MKRSRKKVIVFLADGFEIVEAMTPVDFLRRSGADVTTISWNSGKQVVSSHGIPVTADKTLPELCADDLSDTDLIVIPGGLPGAANLADTEAVLDALRLVHGNGGIVSAICAGPIVLARAGLLKEKPFTCYPGCEEGITDGNYVNRLVVRDGNIITGKGPGAAMHLSLALVEALQGKKIADTVANVTFASESLVK